MRALSTIQFAINPYMNCQIQHLVRSPERHWDDNGAVKVQSQVIVDRILDALTRFPIPIDRDAVIEVKIDQSHRFWVNVGYVDYYVVEQIRYNTVDMITMLAKFEGNPTCCAQFNSAQRYAMEPLFRDESVFQYGILRPCPKCLALDIDEVKAAGKRLSKTLEEYGNEEKDFVWRMADFHSAVIAGYLTPEFVQTNELLIEEGNKRLEKMDIPRMEEILKELETVIEQFEKKLTFSTTVAPPNKLEYAIGDMDYFNDTDQLLGLRRDHSFLKKSIALFKEGGFPYYYVIENRFMERVNHMITDMARALVNINFVESQLIDGINNPSEEKN